MISPLPTILFKYGNEALLCLLMKGEINKDVLSRKGYKYLGVDGFLPRFFQYFWELIKVDLTKDVEELFRMGKLIKSLNNTLVVLVLKI